LTWFTRPSLTEYSRKLNVAAPPELNRLHVVSVGVIWLVVTQCLVAGGLLTSPLGVELPSVVRVTAPFPASGMLDVAETTVVPTTADVITTVQLAVVPPPA